MKRASLLIAAVVAVAAVLAFTVSPISPSVAWAALTAKTIVEGPNRPAPRTMPQAVKVLEVDVAKLARDYAHKRYRAVCADLTKNELKKLGGTFQCMMKMALINAFVPIKKLTLGGLKFARHQRQATISLYVNGVKKHLIRAVVKWEGGAYRLDRESGWRPKF